MKLFVLLADEVSTDMSLEHRDDLSETFISHLFQHTENTSLEEDLGVSEPVLGGVQLQGQKDFLSDNLAISKSLRDGVGGQNGVSTKLTIITVRTVGI